MRRALLTCFACLVAAALIAPAAQAATRYYYFQDVGHQGQMRIALTVVYKNKQRHGSFTPRLLFYDASAPISCNPPVAAGAEVPSVGGPGEPSTPIKLRKRSFNYTYTDVSPPNTPAIRSSGIATGKVIKKKRVDGKVSILDYRNPPDFQNCTSGGPVPYSATPCRQPYNRPSYIKKSLPNCVRDI